MPRGGKFSTAAQTVIATNGLNLGHTIQVNERFSFGPSAGLNYTSGEVDGYTERNGGSANFSLKTAT